MLQKENKIRIDYKIVIYTFFIISSIVFFILPLLLAVSISFSDERSITADGYSFFPKQFSFLAYKFVFSNPRQIINAYVVTAGQSFISMVLSLLIMSMCAYSLSRTNFKFRKQITFYIFFTMLFSGGMIPSYILNTTYLHLKDSFWIYVFPYLSNTFYIIILRTFFKELSGEIVEAAKIDGASELKIFYTIILPLSKPAIATVAFMVLLDRWNDWFTCLLYIQNENLYTLQYLLQRILRQIEYLTQVTRDFPSGVDAETLRKLNNTPSESMRYAMCFVAAGPMMIVFPFFQKYFVRGLTVGAVKG